MTPQLQAGKKLEFEELKTGNGLVLSMKPPSGSAYLQAVKWSERSPVMTQVYQALLCIVAINGDPQITKTEMQITALCDRLGPEAMDEVVEWFQRKTTPEMFEARDLLADKVIGMTQEDALKLILDKANELKAEKLKNSQGIQ